MEGVMTVYTCPKAGSLVDWMMADDAKDGAEKAKRMPPEYQRETLDVVLEAGFGPSSTVAACVLARMLGRPRRRMLAGAGMIRVSRDDLERLMEELCDASVMLSDDAWLARAFGAVMRDGRIGPEEMRAEVERELPSAAGKVRYVLENGRLCARSIWVVADIPAM